MRALLLTVVLVLAACGPRREAAAVDPADLSAAKAALVRLRTEGGQVMGQARPSNMPAFAILPPDGFVTAAEEGGQGPTTGWVEFSTALRPGAVAAFYAEALKTAGLGELRREPDGLSASGQGRTLKLTVQALDGVGSQVRLSYS